MVRRGLGATGILWVRYAQNDVWAVRERMLALVSEHGERLHRMYAVVTLVRARVRKLDARRVALS